MVITGEIIKTFTPLLIRSEVQALVEYWSKVEKLSAQNQKYREAQEAHERQDELLALLNNA